ncbi:DUF3592 domain-containing protein [Nocardiopsis xinjiangensis]|uniref:DUF3592 domain-containing protein n=1 Tax=Nocardiopsis xinjiangensis TaxID=124285 RepID=UPI000379ED69|nr:DUF3592 domain-containing protein [Nocardiopsis xinjiangensis]
MYTWCGAALRARGEQRQLDKAGVSAHGVIRSVHPLERSRHGHKVTVTVDSGRGHHWDTEDPSGLDGYLVREGTPVELVYAPADPSSIRVERAAFSDPRLGSYPVDSGRRPGDGLSVLTALLVPATALVIFGAVITAMLGDPNVLDGSTPFVFLLVGLGLLAGGIVSTVRAHRGSRRRTGNATGTVTETWTRRHHKKNGSTTTHYPFTLHFRSRDGREVHRRYQTDSKTHAPAVDEHMSVQYDPGHPPDFSVSGLVPNSAQWGCGLLLIGTAFTVFGALSGASSLMDGLS